MLRRTKTTIINGKPLLDLPARTVKNVYCDFDPEERAFYDGVEERVKERVDKLEAEGQMQKAYTSMLVLLLRLRQGTLMLYHHIFDEKLTDGIAQHVTTPLWLGSTIERIPKLSIQVLQRRTTMMMPMSLLP